jgi:hypothetical protein
VIRRYLEDDHLRLDQLLARADVDTDAYEQLRAGLLRHIGMEEKILLPAAKRLRGGQPLPKARLLRADHSALAAMLVPSPTATLLAQIRSLLAQHNPIEEGPHGVYAVCETLAAAEADQLLERLKATPEVPLAQHFDGPRAFENIERLLRAAERARELGHEADEGE